MLIPPSIVLIIYGVLGEVSIGQLFIAGIIPGILLAGLYSGYIVLRVMLNPSLAPTERAKFSRKDYLTSLIKLFPVAFLIIFILGSIYSGFATPSEAAALGVLGSIIVSFCLGDLTMKNVMESIKGTINTSAMICFIIVGASFLSVVMGYLHLPRTVATSIAEMGLSPYLLILLLTLFYIVLGFFLDGISMIVMTLPITLPLAVQSGFDPIWFGIFLVLVIEAGQITPPVGFNLFVLQGLTDQPLESIVKAAVPFFLIILFTILLVTLFPQIVLLGPQLMIQ